MQFPMWLTIITFLKVTIVWQSDIFMRFALFFKNKIQYTMFSSCCVKLERLTRRPLRNLQDFTLDMYFRQFWQDPRLSFEKREGLEKLVVGAEYINLIWVPDTFFVNEKTAYFHKATTENQFLRILHTGEILRSIRYFFAARVLLLVLQCTE